ncbi:MAG: DUF4885 family protein [Bacteroidota bacterium]
MRVSSNNLIKSQVLAGYSNSPIQDNLLSLMDKGASKKQNTLFTPKINSTVRSILSSRVNGEKGVYDPRTGSWASSGSYSVTLRNIEDRQRYNQMINDALTEKGIKLSPNEKITLEMDKDGKITVTGVTDPQKKAGIEETLNEAFKDNSVGLMMHIESVLAMNGKDTPEVLDKWMVYDFLKDYTGQDLSELKLINGQITGVNEKLQNILNGELDFGDNNEYVREVMAKLKSVLAYGIDKIPDLKLTIDFQNGSLIDRDVANGFGPEQLKTWFGDFVSGQARWDVKV